MMMMMMIDNPAFMCFVDYEKIFETVSGKTLWRAAVYMAFAPHQVASIKSL